MFRGKAVLIEFFSTKELVVTQEISELLAKEGLKWIITFNHKVYIFFRLNKVKAKNPTDLLYPIRRQPHIILIWSIAYKF